MALKKSTRHLTFVLSYLLILSTTCISHPVSNPFNEHIEPFGYISSNKHDEYVDSSVNLLPTRQAVSFAGSRRPLDGNVFEPVSLTGIEATVSEKGITYAKDVLVEEVLAEIVPLQVSDVNVTTVSTFGTLVLKLTEINLTSIALVDAQVALENQTVTIFAEGIAANVTFNWQYTYADWIGDSGYADVQVESMQTGVTFNLTAFNGTLKMGILEHGVVIEKLAVTMYGGITSWLYNWLIYCFTNHLRAAVESAVDSGMLRAANELDDYLQNYPRRIAVDSVAAIDTTISEDPIVEEDRVSVSALCEFTSVTEVEKSKRPVVHIPDGVVCGDTPKLVTIALTDFVVNSAARVYYEAGWLAYEVDELPDSMVLKLNTASWRILLPALYKEYPNKNMLLDFNTSATPEISFTTDGVVAKVAAEMIILVILDDNSHVGVASLGMDIEMEGWVDINGNNFTGAFQLDNLNLSLKWSTIGNFPVRLIQTVVRTILKSAILPILNRRMVKGFPLPVLPGIQLENASIVYGDQFILVCTDVEYTGGIFGVGKEDEAKKQVELLSSIKHDLDVVVQEEAISVGAELQKLKDDETLEDAVRR